MGSHAHNCKMVKAKFPAKSAPAAVTTLPYPATKPPVPTTTLLHESKETSSYVSSRKAKGSVQPILQDRPKRSYLCKIAGLQGNLAAMFFEKAPGDDAFHHPLKVTMEEGRLKDDGFILLTNRRLSSSSNESMSNESNSYPRKIYIIMMEENTQKARFTVMETACKILNARENNRYNIPYVINELSDITESVLPTVDEWVLDYQVIDIITALYNNVTTTWAQHNRNNAACFFTGPPFCQAAILNLGYINEPSPMNESDDSNEDGTG